MKIGEIRNTTNIPEYEDMEVSIFTDSGEEYVFPVYRCNENGQIFEGDVKHADSIYCDLHDAESVPDDVWAEYLKIKPVIIEQLKGPENESLKNS